MSRPPEARPTDDGANRARPAPSAAPPRVAAPDAARGLALVCMVMAHASMYAKVNILAAGFAGRHLVTPAPGWRLVGLVAYIAPVLFWFVLGMSVALVDGRRANKAEVDRFLLVRAAILFVLDQTLIEFLWAPTRPYHVVLVFELLSALAMTLALLVPLRRLPDAALALLTAVLALGYPLVVHHYTQAQMEAFPLVLRVLFTYDFTHVPMVTFPLVGWLPLPLLGLLLGRRLRRPEWQVPGPWLRVAGACTVVWLLSRLTGYGDYSPWHPGDGALKWFMLSDGPPGLDFMASYVAVGTLVIAGLFSPRMNWHAPWARWLVLLGQVALFLFVAHLGVCFLVSRPLLHLLRHADALRYALTVVGALAILTVMAQAYRAFKARHPRSILRYL